MSIYTIVNKKINNILAKVSLESIVVCYLHFEKSYEITEQEKRNPLHYCSFFISLVYCYRVLFIIDSEYFNGHGPTAYKSTFEQVLAVRQHHFLSNTHKHRQKHLKFQLNLNTT